MNVSEANAAHQVLEYLLAVRVGADVGREQETNAKRYAQFLAQRAHKALGAGVTAEHVDRAWSPRTRPDPGVVEEIARVTGLVVDPDCRDGKHTACVGGQCMCKCHRPAP